MTTFTVKSLLNGYIMLSHYLSVSQESQGFIACDPSRQRVVRVKGYNAKKTGHDELKEYRPFSGNEKVVNVVSQNISSNDGNLIVTTLRDRSMFRTYFLESFNAEHVHLFDSSSTPLLIAHPQDLMPALVYGSPDGNTTSIYKFNGNGSAGSASVLDSRCSLSGIHTSAYVDLKGTLRANLVLHVKSNSRNAMRVYAYTEGAFELITEIQLPNATGPIQFNDFFGLGRMNMIFVSREDNEHFLNVWNLDRDVSEIKDAKSLHEVKNYFKLPGWTPGEVDIVKTKLSLRTFLGGHVPVLSQKIDDVQMPVGMFITDALDSPPLVSREKEIVSIRSREIFLTLRRGEDEIIRALSCNYVENRISEVFNHSQFNATLEDLAGLNVSATFIDLESYGKGNLLINQLDGETYKMIVVGQENHTDRSSISLCIRNSVNGVSMSVPGTCYFLIYENNREVARAQHTSQSSYPSLQKHHVIDLGLSDTNLFLNYVVVRTPCDSAGVYGVESNIVPHTLIVVDVSGWKWSIKAFFSRKNLETTGIGIVVLLIINACIPLVLVLRDRKRYKISMSDDTMKPLFTAL